MLKFHLDENVDNAIARGLRLRGIDVTTSVEVGLVTATDPEQLNYALDQERVIFTHDQDFLRLQHQQFDHFGIVYVWQGSRTIGEIVRALNYLSDVFDPHEMRGRLEFI